MANAILVAKTSRAQTIFSATVANLQNFEGTNRRMEKINKAMNERTSEWMDGWKKG